MAPIISVRDVYKSFGKEGGKVVEVLRGITFDVQKGETICILGGSGGGKSTLLKVMIGAHEATSGEVHIDGENIVGMSEKQLDRVRRIVREAARQSEQPWVPQVHAPAPWFEVVRRPEPHAHRVLCWARGGGPMPALEGDVWVAVGAEAGFTPAEIAEAERESFVPVRLTDRVLRVETAVVVALGLVTSGPTHA